MLSDDIRSVDGVMGGIVLAFAVGNRRFVRFGYAFVCGLGVCCFSGFSNEDIYISCVWSWVRLRVVGCWFPYLGRTREDPAMHVSSVAQHFFSGVSACFGLTQHQQRSSAHTPALDTSSLSIRLIMCAIP